MAPSRTPSHLSETDRTVADPTEDIRGHRVVDSAGTDLGTVAELLVDEDEFKVRFLEIASGGASGCGRDKTYLPVDAIRSITDDTVTIDQSRDVVANAPEYDPAMVATGTPTPACSTTTGTGRTGRPDTHTPRTRLPLTGAPARPHCPAGRDSLYGCSRSTRARCVALAATSAFVDTTADGARRGPDSRPSASPADPVGAALRRNGEAHIGEPLVQGRGGRVSAVLVAADRGDATLPARIARPSSSKTESSASRWFEHALGLARHVTHPDRGRDDEDVRVEDPTADARPLVAASPSSRNFRSDRVIDRADAVRRSRPIRRTPRAAGRRAAACSTGPAERGERADESEGRDRCPCFLQRDEHSR